MKTEVYKAIRAVVTDAAEDEGRLRRMADTSTKGASIALFEVAAQLAKLRGHLAEICIADQQP